MSRKKWEGKYPAVCQKCGKEFIGDKPNRKYCSRKCAGNEPKKKIKKICLYCGEPFYVYERRRETARWCSTKCYNKYRQLHQEFQPAYKGEKPNPPPSHQLPKPKMIKSKRKEEDKNRRHFGNKYPCERCGNPMVWNSSRQKYCKPCAREVALEQAEKRRRENGIHPKEPAKGIRAVDNNIPCEVCGWQKTTCDRHHIIPLSDGGKDKIKNVIVLCPNCHRLAHELYKTYKTTLGKSKKKDLKKTIEDALFKKGKHDGE